MKNFLLPLFSVLLLFIFFIVPVKALTTELVSSSETEKVYSILATPPQDSTAFQLRLMVTGGTIMNVEQADPGLQYLSMCDDGKAFTDNKVCMDIATTSGFFVENQVVIRVTIATTSDTEVVISPDTDHAYLTTNAELVTEEGVVIETFKTPTDIEEPAPITEETTTNDNSSLPFILLIGILVVLVGAFLVIIFFSGHDSKNN